METQLIWGEVLDIRASTSLPGTSWIYKKDTQGVSLDIILFGALPSYTNVSNETLRTTAPVFVPLSPEGFVLVLLRKGKEACGGLWRHPLISRFSPRHTWG
ncbi:MAG: hypothetical protein A2Z14_04880 [Chloroflexi bacterium RBG_16_48_8]|nr:MAG: hypothetical protein A2Z14_04880 [Chloroflexi bacterium RBG_16_48_8]